MNQWQSLNSAAEKTMNTWNISGMFIVLSPIAKIRTCKLATKPQTNNINILACSSVSHVWLAFFLQDNNIPETFLEFETEKQLSKMTWQQYMDAQNEINNAIKVAKHGISRTIWKWTKGTCAKHGI